ncbi:MAG TPA: acylphosphatase [Burkholderiales bacterium]|nr:acylphosphatase [Burkholderiales bacterium]
MITRKLRITGRVQGVGFRDALCGEAQARGLAGWVRNRTDGSVEALVQGPPERVAELIAWARRGPPASRVDEVQVVASDGEPAHVRFERRPTA